MMSMLKTDMFSFVFREYAVNARWFYLRRSVTALAFEVIKELQKILANFANMGQSCSHRIQMRLSPGITETVCMLVILTKFYCNYD
jgi:hypothetical protein